MMNVRYEDFEELVDAQFSIAFNSECNLDAVLVGLDPLGKKLNQDVTAFSLLFETEQTDEYFTQSIVKISHPKITPIEVFISPKGPSQSSGKMLYEVIFN